MFRLIHSWVIVALVLEEVFTKTYTSHHQGYWILGSWYIPNCNYVLLCSSFRHESLVKFLPKIPILFLNNYYQILASGTIKWTWLIYIDFTHYPDIGYRSHSSYVKPVCCNELSCQCSISGLTTQCKYTGYGAHWSPPTIHLLSSTTKSRHMDIRFTDLSATDLLEEGNKK